MKTASALAFVASVLPTLTSASINVNWNFPNAPSTGLKDVIFPFNIANAPHKSGFYFAQQYTFKGIDSASGYAGLQPRSDKDGSSIVHAVFSSFTKGSTTDDHHHCSSGADGGSGVSCAVEIAAPYDHTYNVVVKNTNGTTWTGTLVDSVLGNSTHIGTYTLPSKAGNLDHYQAGFVEYFSFNSGKHTCDEQPHTNATFYPPTSSTPGSGSGTLTKPQDNRGCGDDKDNFHVRKVDNQGYEFSVGHKDN